MTALSILPTILSLDFPSWVPHRLVESSSGKSCYLQTLRLCWYRKKYSLFVEPMLASKYHFYQQPTSATFSCDRYGSTWSISHGITGVLNTVQLKPSENIIGVTISYTNIVIGLDFTTSMGKYYGPYGSMTGSLAGLSHPNCILAYISGHSGDILDGINLHWGCV